MTPFRPATEPHIPGAGSHSGQIFGFALLAGAAILGAALVAADPSFATMFPAAALGALVCARWPTPAVLGIFLLAGAEASIIGFLGLQPRQIAELLLAGLWLGVAFAFVSGRRRPLWIWPALLAPALYIGLSAIEVPLSDPVSLGLRSFRASVLPMTAVLLLAIAPWPSRRFIQIARGVLVIAALVGIYALYRWIVGSSAEETGVALHSLPGARPRVHDLRFFASFPTAQQLASFCATALPLALAAALGWRGRWRLLALTTLGTLGLALVASKAAAGAFAALVGVGVALALYVGSPAFPSGRRVATGFMAVVAIAAIGTGAFMVAIAAEDDDPQSDVFIDKILHPSEDESYQIRLNRWEEVMDEVVKAPFGHGLGTVGRAALRERDELDVSYYPGFDSSYLKVGVEQGLVVMVLYVIALLLLLGGLVLRVLKSTDRARSVVAIGSCGALAALMVLFYAGFYSQHIQAMSAWIIVGLGAALFTHRPSPSPRARSTTTGLRRTPAPGGSPGSAAPAPQRFVAGRSAR